MHQEPAEVAATRTCNTRNTAFSSFIKLATNAPGFRCDFDLSVCIGASQTIRSLYRLVGGRYRGCPYLIFTDLAARISRLIRFLFCKARRASKKYVVVSSGEKRMKSISKAAKTNEYDAECIAERFCFSLSFLKTSWRRRCWRCLYPKGVVSEGWSTYE